MQWIPIWKKAPFIRLLIPFCLAIMCQWYLPVLPKIFVYMAVSYLAGLFSMQFLPIALQFKLGWITGLLLNLLIFCVGLIITHHADVRTHAKWFKRLTSDSDRILLTVNEPLSLKANSYKTIATINGVLHGDTYLKTEGRVLIYFSKDSSCSNLRYGDLLMVNKYFQSIINPGNPGGFDYKQYCAFKQIYHQVYLKPGEYTVIRGNNGSALTKYLVAARNKILSVLQLFKI